MARRSGRRGFPPMVALLMGGAILTIVALSKASQTMGAASIPIWLAAIGGAVFLLRGPLGEALLHSVANADVDQSPATVDPGVLQELDDLRAQVGELQERMDFTERLLAREREMRPLGTGEPK